METGNKNATKTIDLALQGGGSHGAFSWGVLDRLLADERLDIEAISGTSAGAMNAVVLADGFHRGGRDGAREGLENFWRAVSKSAESSPIQRSLWDKMTGNYSLETSPAYHLFDHVTRLFSPYDLNPLDINPLRDLVAQQVDFDRVNACKQIKIHVTATNVRTGQARIFSRGELSADAVMASACLPFIFKAVEINGEAYWDGGYTGNPALYPLVDQGPCRDMVIVQINPVVRTEIPRSARDILNRLNEITFNSSLIKELRAIHLLHQLIEVGGLEAERYRDMRVHLIHADEELQAYGASSKLNAEWSYLSLLFDRGRHWASTWLDQNFDRIGDCSTFNLGELFQDSIRAPETPARKPAPEPEPEPKPDVDAGSGGVEEKQAPSAKPKSSPRRQTKRGGSSKSSPPRKR
jgi:NTE family protein